MATGRSTDETMPMRAVREALGLSHQDVNDILGVQDAQELDDLQVRNLARFAKLNQWGRVILRILEPDDTTFREWQVTPRGTLVEVRDDQ